VADLGEVIDQIDSGHLVAATIDIPIGLAAAEPRAVDFEARARLGPRKSSVFPAPVRRVLDATTYEEACQISRGVCGKGISRQLFAILPKIREVDELQSPQRQERFVEMHPELSFTALAGAPMEFHKSTDAGRTERLHALRAQFPDVESVTAHRLQGTQPDDILDAFVGAWSARRYATGTHLRLGGETDETGLRMEMIA
jgi:predicted RNase H-like nuclease